MNDAVLPGALLAASPRILVIDDNKAIHQDFRKIFGASRGAAAPSAAEKALFGGGELSGAPEFQVDSAYQGEEGLALVRLAQQEGRPYALAFVDGRMPPGWDGIETVARIWQHDADIQVVICTAYSDYSWSEMLAKLGRSDRLVILKKPFDTIEVVQLASALTEKWRLARQARSILDDLERKVAVRTRELLHTTEIKSAILESSLDAIVTIDHQGKIVEFNPAAEAAFGLTREDARGQVMVDLIVPPRLRDAHRRGFAHYLASGEGPILGRRLELEALRADGSEFPIELAITAIEAGSTPMFTGFIRDITARKEADEKIRRLNRVYAVLSGINSLIVRVKDRNALFDGACRMAIESGGFSLAWIGVVDRSALQMKLVASQGAGQDYLERMPLSLSEADGAFGLAGRTVRENRPVVVDDMQHDSRVLLRAEAGQRDFHSLVMLPLTVSGAVAGVLALYAREIGFFDEAEMKLLLELAGDIAFALEHLEKVEKLTRMTRVNAMLSGVNAAIVRIRDRQELFEEACRIAVQTAGLPFAWFSVVDEAEMRLRPVASAGTDGGFLDMISHRLSLRDDAPAGYGVSARSVREGRAAVVHDVDAAHAYPNYRALYAERGIRTVAAFPVLVAGRAVGAFGLLATEAGFFNDDEMKLVNEVASNIAFALEHIEKEEKVRRLTRVQAVLSGINSVIVRAMDSEALFKESCRIAVEEGKFAMAWVGRFDPATQEVTPVAWAGESAQALTRAKSSSREGTPAGSGGVGRSIRERRPVFNNDIKAKSFGGPRLAEILRLGFRSQITLPLYEEQTIVATLTLYTREPGFFDAGELGLLTELAGDISFALQNISRQQKLDKLARIRAISSQINAAIVRIREPEALLRETCRIAAEHGKFDLVWTGLVDQEKQRIQPVAWKGFSTEHAHSLTWAHLGNPRMTLAEVLRTRKVAVRNDDSGESPVGTLRHHAMQQGYRSAACVPFMVDEAVVAAMILFAPEPAFFDAEELALLNEVAADVSFALQATKKQEQLDYLAYYDPLTGLANRRLFLERVAQYMRSAAAGGHPLALFFLDLERFRNINDSLGRPAGDALLKQVATWLTRNLGDASLVARAGGDVFAVVLPEVRAQGNVARLVEKTMDAFLAHPFRLNDSVFRITFKVGIALFPDNGAEVDTLFRNAEAALKNAKASGDRYLFYAEKMTAAVAGRLTLENQLRQALEREEFVLHYQPKVNLASGKMTSAEALIRWNDPQTGLVPPGRFIPVLEETGLINEVGRWALRKAIADYLRWLAAGLPAVRIAVNVSPLQLRNRGFVAEIAQVVGIDPHARAGLELEITESLIMEDVKHNIASLKAIREMDVRIAIDDFGTGFSSLSYLSKLPVDTLKIDRSFVIDMTAAPEGLSLVSTIINLAHSLKLKVVAEGVETEEQSRLLRLLNCDEMQGYLFSKPVPGEIFEARFLALPVVA